MKRTGVRFLPIFILLAVGCSFINPESPPAPAPVETSAPTGIPSPDVTVPPPLAGDLGFGNVTGVVTDADTGQPIADATVTCEHYSYTSSETDRCNRTTMTDEKGAFLFEKVFFHDTDTITLTVSAPGYSPKEIKQTFFTWNEWRVDISLKHVP